MNQLLKIAIISSLCLAGMPTLVFKGEHQKLCGSLATILVWEDYSIENDADTQFSLLFLSDNNDSLNKAVRINCRYRERLAGFGFFSDADIKKENSPNNWTSKKSLFNLPLNNHCLSSCFDYIFLFTLF